MAKDLTEIPVPSTLGPDPIRIHHPEGAFVPTPASRIALEAIGDHQGRFRGRGLDWGSGSGLLAIAAARLAAVEEVIGLELDPRGVAAAGRNARANQVHDKVRFVESNAYRPASAEGRRLLAAFRGTTDFMIANPPSSSPVGDGFEMRRVVVRGARDYLKPGGVLLLSVSAQYGEARVEGLLRDAPGFRLEGVAATTGLVPFDMGRPDLRRDVLTYAREEERGGLPYAFRDPRDPERAMTAVEARRHYRESGESPLSRWQSRLLVWANHSLSPSRVGVTRTYPRSRQPESPRPRDSPHHPAAPRPEFLTEPCRNTPCSQGPARRHHVFAPHGHRTHIPSFSNRIRLRICASFRTLSQLITST